MAQLTDADLARLGETTVTLDLESKLATALRATNKMRLSRLADSVERSESKLLGRLSAMAERPDKAQALALKLGPCHYAGISIRTTILGLAHGVFHLRIGPKSITVVPIDGNMKDPTATYAENMHRCELIRKLPASTRMVGSKCSITGEDCEVDD